MGSSVRERLEGTHLGSGSRLAGEGKDGGGRGERRWGIISERRSVSYMPGKRFKLLPARGTETVDGETSRGGWPISPKSVPRSDRNKRYLMVSHTRHGTQKWASLKGRTD